MMNKGKVHGKREQNLMRTPVEYVAIYGKQKQKRWRYG